MDPDRLLEMLRTGEGDFHENFADLDEWLSKGGFPPKDWSRFVIKGESARDTEIGEFDRYGRLHVRVDVDGQPWVGWLEPAGEVVNDAN